MIMVHLYSSIYLILIQDFISYKWFRYNGLLLIFESDLFFITSGNQIKQVITKFISIKNGRKLCKQTCAVFIYELQHSIPFLFPSFHSKYFRTYLYLKRVKSLILLLSRYAASLLFYERCRRGKSWLGENWSEYLLLP